MSLGEAHAMVRFIFWLIVILIGSVVAFNIGMALGSFLLVFLLFHPQYVWVYELIGVTAISILVLRRFVR